MAERIAVGMSGGIDSSVAAALLKDQGFEVFGMTAKLWPSGSRCCSDEDIRDAQRVCAHLGIPHYVVDLHEEFHAWIIDYFVAEYVRGRTPSPCALCNHRIKFGALMTRALDSGALRMATGHYARIVPDLTGLAHLRAGLDAKKDQTYFLFDLTQAQLSRTLFPLGEMTKTEVRRYAKQAGLPVTSRGESQDLCFAKSGEHHRIVEALHPDAAKPGDIVDAEGRKLGTHEGLHRCTIGQRRGLGLARGTPLYVSEIRADTHTVVVAPRAALYRSSAIVKSLNWISAPPPSSGFRARARIRYNHEAALCRVDLNNDGVATVTFEEPQFAITPGQIAAFYADDELLGGGWIQ